TGLETLRADHIDKKEERTIFEHKETGAKTSYVKLTTRNKRRPTSFESVKEEKPKFFFRNVQSGRVYAALPSKKTRTDAKTGAVYNQYKVVSPTSYTMKDTADIDYALKKGKARIVEVTEKEAEKLWEADIKAAGEYEERTVHLITGALTPIWDRLTGRTRVIRTQTDAGERLLGRVIPPSEIQKVLGRFGVKEISQT